MSYLSYDGMRFFLLAEAANDRRGLLRSRCEHTLRGRRTDGCDFSLDVRDSFNGSGGHFDRRLHRRFRRHQQGASQEGQCSRLIDPVIRYPRPTVFLMRRVRRRSRNSATNESRCTLAKERDNVTIQLNHEISRSRSGNLLFCRITDYDGTFPAAVITGRIDLSHSSHSTKRRCGAESRQIVRRVKVRCT